MPLYDPSSLVGRKVIEIVTLDHNHLTLEAAKSAAQLYLSANMPFLAKVGSVLKSCVSASADFAGEQTMKLLKSQYPDINDVIVVLDQVKDRVKVTN